MFAAAMSAVLVSLGAAPLAQAQAIDTSSNTGFATNNTETDSFARANNISVRERPRPDYQEEGIHVGGFMIYPRVNTAIGYDDNIFATQIGKVSDEIFTVAPQVDVRSTWSRNALNGYARLAQSVFFNHGDEDTTQYEGGADGKYEFGGATVGEAVLTGGVDFGRFALPRSAANSGSNGAFGAISKNPIEYDLSTGSAQLADTFNRLRLSARVDLQNYDYSNGETASGIPVLEQYLNRNDNTYTVKSEYAVSPDTALFVAAAYNNRAYQQKPPTVGYNSDNDGYNIAGGANFDITHLTRGEVQLGYLNQHYASSLFKDISGLSAKGQVEWFPTQLVTVTGTVLRAVGDSGIIGSAGYLTTTGGLQVDYEFRRNVIITVNATGTGNKYQGIARNDTIYTAGASANWLINRRMGLTLAYTHADQSSSGFARGPSYTDNRVSLSLVFQR
jgi:hypothetical protein